MRTIAKSNMLSGPHFGKFNFKICFAKLLSRHADFKIKCLPIFFRHNIRKNLRAQVATCAVFAFTGQQFVRNFIQSNLLQHILRLHVLGEHNRPGDHQVDQGHAVVFCQVSIHALKGVIPFRVPSRNFVNVHILVVMLLPAGQNPVSPEQVRDAALTTAEHACVTAQGNGKIVTKRIGTAHEAAFVDEALQLVPGLVHLFQFGRGAQDFPGRIEDGDPALLPPDFHLPHVPLVSVAGGVDLQLRQQSMYQRSHPVVGQDQSVDAVLLHQFCYIHHKILHLGEVIKPVVHSVHRADAPHSAVGDTQKVQTVAYIVGPVQVGLGRIRIFFVPPVKGKAHVGEHFLIGQFAIDVVNILFSFFYFLQKPGRVSAVIRKGIDPALWVHNISKSPVRSFQWPDCFHQLLLACKSFI